MKTKRILTNQAVPGMVVADDVYTFNNQLIIGKNSTLTNRTITRLKFYSINDIRIIIDEGASDEPEEPSTLEGKIEKVTAFFPPTQSFSEYVRKTPEFKKFNRKFDNSVSSIRTSFAQIMEDDTAPINTNQFLGETRKILSECRNGVHLFHMLECMRDYDDLTYAHSLSVSLICNAFGRWLGFSEEDITALTLSGLLHDIGKIQMPHEIIAKPAALTKDEYDIIKTHPQKGYDAVKDKPLDSRVKNAILMHQERCDGSGYPNGLTIHEIDDFAKIVAIADTYEAMTAARVYREAICPFEVIRIFEMDGLYLFDPKFLLPFLENMVETYVNSRVHLSNGLEGEVILINKLNLARPIVKVQNLYIDLSKRKHLSITSVI